jgi:hypothetical protein
MRYKFMGTRGQIGFGDSYYDAVRATGRRGELTFAEVEGENFILVWQGSFLGCCEPVIKQPTTGQLARSRGVNFATVLHPNS